MNRKIIYPGEIPLDTDVLTVAKDGYIGVSKIMESLLGHQQAAYGFNYSAVADSFQLRIDTGVLYQHLTLDSTGYGSLGTDSQTVTKQGILETAQTFTCNPPATSGYAINYLIQAHVVSADTDAVVLPYYNSANPSMTFNGPNNTGVSQVTRRKDTCVLSMKTGTAATSGTQVTPTADTGYMPLYVVTVVNGQTILISGNVSIHDSAVFLPDLLNVTTGFSFRYGTVSLDYYHTQQEVTFSTPFKLYCYGVLPVPVSNYISNGVLNAYILPSSVSKTGFTLVGDIYGPSASTVRDTFYVAIGK